MSPSHRMIKHNCEGFQFWENFVPSTYLTWLLRYRSIDCVGDRDVNGMGSQQDHVISEFGSFFGSWIQIRFQVEIDCMVSSPVRSEY